MHVWVHMSNPTKLTTSLQPGTQVGVAEPLPEPVVLTVFNNEEAGLVLERFEWELTPVTNSTHLASISITEAEELVGCTDPDLTPGQKEQLHELLMRNSDLFSVKLTPGQAHHSAQDQHPRALTHQAPPVSVVAV